MTDKGSGFVLADDELRKTHILCSPHKAKALMSCRAGLSKSDGDYLYKKLCAAIYQEFEDEGALDVYLLQLREVCWFKTLGVLLF